MLWLILMTVYMIANVWYTLLLKVSPLPKADKYVTYASMTTVFLLSAGILMSLGYGEITPDKQQLFYLARQVLFYVGANMATIIALNHTDASIFSIINSLRIVVVTILSAMLLKDLPPMIQLIGGALILASIFVLKLHKDKRYLSKPIVYSIIAMFVVSINVTAEKHMLNYVNPVTAVFWTSLFIAPVMWIVVVLRKGSFKKSLPYLKHKNTGWLLIMRPLSAWSFTVALTQGSVAVTNYVSSLSVVFVVLFGIITLKEKDQTVQKIIAIAIAFIGLTLILISKLAN